MEKRIVDICKKTYDLIIKGNTKFTEDEKNYMVDLHKFISTDSDKDINGIVEDIIKVGTTKTIIKRK